MNESQRAGASLQDVADLAGVHRSTASRALNARTRAMVARDVALRVEGAARALGYRPDIAASALRTGRTRLVGVVLPDIANPVFGPILAGVEAVLADAGYSALVSNAGIDPERQIAAVRQLIARRVEGLVLATAALEDPAVSECLAARVPAVLVNRAERAERVPAVVPDDRRGMELAVTHLVSLGHRRIAFLGGPVTVSTGLLRAEGFAAAMAAEGLDASMRVDASAYSRTAGRAAAARLLDTQRFTAVAVANDLLALGFLEEMKARGLDCPGDVSVVGHNDMPLVDMVAPALTTIRIRQDDIGRRAAEVLLAHIGGSAGEARTLALAPELVLRDSTAPPPP